jgi:hypothetical protein
MHIQRLDLTNQRDVRRYVEFPFRLYHDCPQWVPPLVNEAYAQLDANRHPFYQHSQAAFFLALEGDEVVGRVAVLDNARYNQRTEVPTAFFYHFDAVDDRAVSRVLFEAAFDWARDRDLERLWGPKGFIAVDGQGVLVEGFEHRPALGIPYNYDYYGELLEDVGFEKQLDFISSYMNRETDIPSRFLEIAERVKQRRGFRTIRFRTKSELRAMIPRVAATYNAAFTEVQGYTPITEAEARAIADRILSIADPSLITVLMKGDEIAGFVLAYADISAAIQRCRGRLWPTGWYHLMRELKRTSWLNVNSGGILEEYRGLGGDALLFSEIHRAVFETDQFQHVDLVQVQETNTRMVRELEALKAKPYKLHRIYRRGLV